MSKHSSKPEKGLAEWSSKIRALQRAVDQDEENEQKKLEEEIAASRLARQRRSQTRGHAGHTSSWDAGKEGELRAQLARIDSEPKASDDLKMVTDRKTSQAETLFKLTGNSPVSTPSKSTPPFQSTKTWTTTPKSTVAEPMSLAAFMGGNATGPRLKKHAAQQDAHDPTQFEQRTRVDRPHPVFGSGGVAMPGMASKQLPKQSPFKPIESFSRKSPSPIPTTPTYTHKPQPEPEKRSTPSPTRSISPQKTESRRERTLSTPSKPSPKATTPPKRTSPEPPNRPASRPSLGTPDSNTNLFLPKGPTRTSPTTSLNVPSLARPVQPEPRQNILGPQLPVSKRTSPAFLRAPQPKDPTPSLSRLKGRGFVQSMIQASSNLELSVTPPLSPPPERSRTPTNKKGVLDRWQPPSPATKPPVAPKPLTTRKSLPSLKSPATDVISPLPIRKAASRTSLPGKESPIQERSSSPPKARGLGSNTTKISFINSMEGKRTSVGFTDAVDEMGMRTKVPVEPPAVSAAVASKPLVHPTKDRARKPKKGDTKIKKAVSFKMDSPPSVAVPLEKELEKELSTPVSSNRWPSQIIPLEKGPEKVEKPAPAIASRWSSQTVIGVKPVGPAPAPIPVDRPHSQGLKLGRALPGLTSKADKPSPPTSVAKSYEDLSAAPSPSRPTRGPSPGPNKHKRIPSTGNRATVMDVAQTLLDPPQPPAPEPAPEPTVEPMVAPVVVTSPVQEELQPISKEVAAPPQSEKRRSSYEKYSTFSLPPLKEEATPTSTPHGTLARSTELAPMIKPPTQSKPLPKFTSVTIEHSDGPLPSLNLDAIDTLRQSKKRTQTEMISVEVFVIGGNTSRPITESSNIFYDSELLAIVYRSKNKSSGLVVSSVWGWQGKSSELGDKGAHKLHEISKRYGTSLLFVKQRAEPVDLVRAIGGQLIIRQGARHLWSSENTTMYAVRGTPDAIFIDECDLSIRNLCSGYSFVISVLDTLYVWHGRGANPSEKHAAFTYAQSLGGNVVELTQGLNDNDEMFWMILGEEQFNDAYYWKWRSDSLRPRVWRLDARSGEDAAYPVNSLDRDTFSHGGVYVVDCVFEYFVIVGSKARGARDDIRLALLVAQALSDRVCHSRPFNPPVHTIILPSQLPLDLLHQFRGMDENLLNDGKIPDHMNLVTASDAAEQLARKKWKVEELQDCNMLPLGVDQTMVDAALSSVHS